ncbi:MAG: 16S rRNA (guanine(966)-N(2))-methyltransferase RsmD [Coriobacteriia bacterium]
MSTRPTTDRVREAVFSALVARFAAVDSASVLDAFAGSGALGLEALSRGAAHATFVDNDRPSLMAMRSNVTSLGLEASASIVARDVFRTDPSELPGGPFSLLFVDPPYRIVPAQVNQLLTALARGGALESGAVIAYEHAASSQPDWPDGFEPAGTKRYGDTSVSYAVWEGEPPS